MRLTDIPQMTKVPIYAVDQPWGSLEKYLQQEIDYGLQLEPDFQRGHVWTPAQRIAFIEYKLRGGRTGGDVFFNHPNFQRGKLRAGDAYVLVDGLQRLTAIRMFLRDEVPVFGTLLSAFEDQDLMRRTFSLAVSVRVHVNDLPARADVLKWYLEMNTGGTPHSADEIRRVRELYQQAAKERG